MKRLYLRTKHLSLASLILFLSGLFAYPQDEMVDFSNVINYYKDTIPKLLSESGVPGFAVAVVNNDSVIWSNCFGFTDTIKQTPINTETIFSVQSISKNFTALAALKAVDDGLVELDVPINKYLPNFTVNSRFDEHPEQIITLRMLLGHRAGFAHEAPLGSNYFVGNETFEEHVQSISQTWLRFPVNQRHSYSNLGVDLAGYILQVVSGIPFHEYVRLNILKPIGMNNSTFDMSTLNTIDNRAVGHSQVHQRLPLEFTIIPSGGLYASVTDMAKYLQMLLNKGKYYGAEILPEKYFMEMYLIPSRNRFQISGYGLGVGISEKYSVPSYNHGGRGFGFCSNMIWYPDYSIGIIMLTNSADHGFQQSLPNRIIEDFVKAKGVELKSQPLTKDIPLADSINVSQSQNNDFAGVYLYNSGGIMILVSENNQLGWKLSNGFKPITFISESEGFGLIGDEKYLYRFVRDKQGNPSHIMRFYDGEFLDLNELSNDIQGLAKPEWSQYTGDYSYNVLYRPASRPLTVTQKNGYLYLYDYMKLTEYQPGLFFTGHGEVLDVRDDKNLSWRNIRIWKIK